MGRWGFGLVDKLLRITFPGIEISHDSSRKPDLVVSSHFRQDETLEFSCPYITWSGEPYRVSKFKDLEPLCEINTFDCDESNAVYCPLLAQDSKTVRCPQQASDKKYCCAYAFSNIIPTREQLFNSMRKIEATCYGFGNSCRTYDNPFDLPRANRFENSRAFKDFGLIVALENEQKSGYFTEKIGMAFESGSVPIYDSSNGIDRFINRESYFDVSAYADLGKAGEAAVHIWKDKQKLQRYLDAPVRVNKYLDQFEINNINESRPWMKPFIDALSDHFNK